MESLRLSLARETGIKLIVIWPKVQNYCYTVAKASKWYGLGGKINNISVLFESEFSALSKSKNLVIYGRKFLALFSQPF